MIKHLLAKTALLIYYLKFSLVVFLKCFLTFALFQPHVSYRHVSYKKLNVYRFMMHVAEYICRYPCTVRASLHIYMHPCNRILLHIYMHPCNRIHLHIYMHPCSRIYLHIYMHPCNRILLHIYMHPCNRIHLNIYMHPCIFLFILVYTCVYLYQYVSWFLYSKYRALLEFFYCRRLEIYFGNMII